MIDFHSHLVPGVDDGSSSMDETRAALAAYRDQGVRTVVTTPHLRASLTEKPAELAEFVDRVEAAWAGVTEMAAAEFPELTLARGFEVALDTPRPDLSDPRVRLAGTRFVLVEFPSMTVPPNVGQTVFELKLAGFTPIVAHPERYSNLDERLGGPEEWRRMGAHLQVNCGSLLGKYGADAERAAWRLLRRGWVDYLSSDYHARGTLHVATARAALERAGGEVQAELLLETNPARMLEGKPPRGVPPLTEPEKPLWKRLFGGGRK